MFEQAAHSQPGTQNGQPRFDQIRAYESAEAFQDGDQFDLAAIDANTTLSGNQAFTWGGEIALNATGQKGWLYASERNGDTLIRGNTDDNAAWEFQIEIEDGNRPASWYLSIDFVL